MANQRRPPRPGTRWCTMCSSHHPLAEFIEGGKEFKTCNASRAKWRDKHVPLSTPFKINDNNLKGITCEGLPWSHPQCTPLEGHADRCVGY